MKRPTIPLLCALGLAFACQSPSPGAARALLFEDSGLEEVVILAKGLE